MFDTIFSYLPAHQSICIKKIFKKVKQNIHLSAECNHSAVEHQK